MSWYAIQVIGGMRGAKRVANAAHRVPLDVFARVPLISETQRPILPGYVLIKTPTITPVMGALWNSEAARYLVSVPAGRKIFSGAAGMVSADELRAIEVVEKHGIAEVLMVTPDKVPVGREVEITKGSFAGVRARLAVWEGSEEKGWRMVVELKALGRVLLVPMNPALAKQVYETASRSAQGSKVSP